MAKNNKSLNPVAAQKRAQQKKDKLKKKTERKENRDASLKSKDLDVINKSIAVYRKLENEGRLDKNTRMRLDTLLENKRKIELAKEEEAAFLKQSEVAPFEIPKDPTRSIYYHPVLNPYGAPPPGQPYLEIGDVSSYGYVEGDAEPTSSAQPQEKSAGQEENSSDLSSEVSQEFEVEGIVDLPPSPTLAKPTVPKPNPPVLSTEAIQLLCEEDSKRWDTLPPVPSQTPPLSALQPIPPPNYLPPLPRGNPPGTARVDNVDIGKGNWESPSMLSKVGFGPKYNYSTHSYQYKPISSSMEYAPTFPHISPTKPAYSSPFYSAKEPTQLRNPGPQSEYYPSSPLSYLRTSAPYAGTLNANPNMVPPPPPSSSKRKSEVEASKKELNSELEKSKPKYQRKERTQKQIDPLDSEALAPEPVPEPEAAAVDLPPPVVTYSAQPQLRNLQKELTSMVPTNLLRKRAKAQKAVAKAHESQATNLTSLLNADAAALRNSEVIKSSSGIRLFKPRINTAPDLDNLDSKPTSNAAAISASLPEKSLEKNYNKDSEYDSFMKDIEKLL